MKRLLSVLIVLQLIFGTAGFSILGDTRPAPEERGSSGLALSLRRLQTIASVLHTAAHPDDESTELLAYEARGIGARAAYLSLNRGEGGQNGIGPELFDALGVIRTEELLAARKLDGAEQYFTRAFDFGFTTSPAETLQKWNREEILGDMVRVIRRFRPLVLVSGFSGTSRDGHGQHQVAGMLTPEAIKAAADPSRFPEQLKDEGLQPWQVLKVYGRLFGTTTGPRADFNTGAFDPILGRSYYELAADGRSRHRSQDFGMIQGRGIQLRSFPRLQSSVEVPEVETSLFTGLDVTIVGTARFAGSHAQEITPSLETIGKLAARALNEYKPQQPLAIAQYLADGLAEVRKLRVTVRGWDPLTKANVDNILARKEAEFSDSLAKAHGVVVDALSSVELVSPGESLEINANVYVGSLGTGDSKTLAPAVSLRLPEGWKQEGLKPEAAPQGGGGFRGRETPSINSRFRATVPDNAQSTQPYWLARPRTRDQYDWDNKMPRNLPFGPSVAEVNVDLLLNGQKITISQPVEYRFADKTYGEIRRELKVTPELTLTVEPAMLVIPSGATNRTREVTVDITHNASRKTDGTVTLQVPAGWKVVGNDTPLSFTRQREKTSRMFKVTPPAGATGNFELRAVATAAGREFKEGYQVVSYPHIEQHLIYHEARTKVNIFDLAVASNLKVGYVIGSGDDGPQALRQMGVSVNIINAAELASGDLSKYDVIVLGIRVYEVNEDAIANNRRLLDYVSNGGTMIVQYNKPEFATGNFAPYSIKMAGSIRITDETAPITVLDPSHPFFNWPNKIQSKDWEGWIQERGLYFASDWDPNFTPLLSGMNENSQILKGGELIASYGKGTYIYSGYAWFRQFPAGVSGPYRMFANMISWPRRAGAVKQPAVPVKPATAKH